MRFTVPCVRPLFVREFGVLPTVPRSVAVRRVLTPLPREVRPLATRPVWIRPLASLVIDEREEYPRL